MLSSAASIQASALVKTCERSDKGYSDRTEDDGELWSHCMYMYVSVLLKRAITKHTPNVNKQ